MALNLIETLKTSIHSPKQTKYENTCSMFENPSFQNKKSVVCWFSWQCLYFMLRVTQPN